MVEGARLESVYTGNGIAGSNPALSAFARRIRQLAEKAGFDITVSSAGLPGGLRRTLSAAGSDDAAKFFRGES